jgi:hypothetical protein
MTTSPTKLKVNQGEAGNDYRLKDWTKDSPEPDLAWD